MEEFPPSPASFLHDNKATMAVVSIQSDFFMSDFHQLLNPELKVSSI
jgi:hypothetical protein